MTRAPGVSGVAPRSEECGHYLTAPTHAGVLDTAVASAILRRETHEPPWYVARCLEVEGTSQRESVEEALNSHRAGRHLGVSPSLPIVSGRDVVRAPSPRLASPR